MTGGAGNDALTGSDGGDTIVGGAGADSMLGGFDNDVIEAYDDEADTQIHGGAGADTAYVDAGVDPATIAVETAIPR
jgi:Ca2+-binding RTX toxin-like protein